jgi:hypothetical protein
VFLFFEVFAVRGEGEKLNRSKTSPKIHPKNLGGFAPWRFKKFLPQGERFALDGGVVGF